ncbi:MAG: hypothetical protein ABIG66_01520 [Candidatus Kerfeldbacteria bacterium]
MPYIDAIKGTIIAFAIFLIAVIIIPGKGPSNDIELILTISSFLFAILAGFFISRLSSRYDGVRQAVAQEDALLLSIYKTSQIVAKPLAKKIGDMIDKYYIVAYDFSLSESNKAYKVNAAYFMKMWELAGTAIRQQKPGAVEMIDQLKSLEVSRNTSSAVSTERMGAGQWVVMFILTGIILFSVFYLKMPELYSQVIAVLLSTALILVMLIMRDLQNMMLGGKHLLEESGQEVLEFIGKKRYYSEYYVKRDISEIPDYVTEYRIGSHKPGETKFKIKTIKREGSKKKKG